MARDEQRRQHLCDVAFTIFVLSCPDTEPALTYLALNDGPLDGERRRQHERDMHERLGTTDFGELCRTHHGDDLLLAPTRVHSEATSFLREHCLHKWIECRNDQGLTPTSGMVSSHVRNAPDGTELAECASRHLLPPSASGGRHWLDRFTQRWNIVKGTAVERENTSLQVRRDKVRCPKKRLGELSFVCAFCPDLKKGRPENGRCLSAALQSSVLEGGRFPAAFFFARELFLQF